jgi:hypothetical protein
MAAKAPIAIHNNVFNEAIIKGNALRFNDANDVFNIIQSNHLPDEIQIEDNYVKIASEFTWEKIVNHYEYYFLACYLNNQPYYPLKHATLAAN